MSTIESLDAASEKGSTVLFKDGKGQGRTSRMASGGEDELDIHSMKLGSKKHTLTQKERRRLVMEADKKKKEEEKAARGGKSKLCSIF